MYILTPKESALKWVELFNKADSVKLSDLYHEDAINHQVANNPIREMFENEFSNAEMVCIVENIFEDGNWAILEWKDPLGLRGCGFFHITENKIKLQRGYWDKLTFLQQHNLPFHKEIKQ